MPSQYMKRALTLARRGQGRTSPNPMVGAVIVDRSGRIVGEGYHRQAGGPHAEVLALAHAGSAALGATLYVTLEPCNHTGRTPPCTEAIMRAGISEVVAAVADPNPLVPGGGLARLQQAGLKVRVGDGEEEALALNQAFFTWSRHHRPWITLKAAMTLDGKVADRSGASKYLTSAPALKHAHALRREHDAILVGSGTILADNPRLTYRGAARGRDPIRVVLDTRGRISSQAEVFCVNSDAPTLVFTAETTDVDWERALFSVGAEVIRVASGPDGHVWLPEVIAHLADRRILSVLVEGGPTTHAAFLAHQLADRWVGYMAPRILGGTEAPSSVGGHGFLLAQAPPLIINRVMRRGADVIIDALFVPATPVSLPGQAEHQIASQGVS